MELKRVEMIGFKSFPEKINVEFGKGITAIVGPNGSGKGNISDAVRWVLGEQSAKTLRGSKMEDVIFAGTERRKPVNFAQVTLVLDNQDKKMAVDFDEVAISRRVFRSGESEYQINGSRCRLKDVQEMLMDTGIGKDGYSVIGQGQIDQLLSTKPQDRLMDCAIAASRGLGKSVVPTVIVLLGSCVFRIVWIETVFAHFGTVPSLYLLYIFSWTITAVMENLYFIHIYKKTVPLLK